MDKWLAGGIVIGVVLGVGTSRVYARTVSVKTDWRAGDILKALDINDNFQRLQDAINKNEVYTNRKTAEVTPLVAQPCGVSQLTDGLFSTAGMVRYRAAREICKTATGCSSAARICLAHDLVLFASTGGRLDAFTSDSDVWYATAVVSIGYVSNATSVCNGFTATNVNGAT